MAERLVETSCSARRRQLQSLQALQQSISLWRGRRRIQRSPFGQLCHRIIEMISRTVRNFMKQQGFVEEPESVCDMHFSGLYFQPRIMGPLVVVAIILQSPVFFFVLSAMLWWNVAFPKWNPFGMFYNRAIAAPRGKPLLAPSPAPRAFAQGMAAAFMLLAGVAR